MTSSFNANNLLKQYPSAEITAIWVNDKKNKNEHTNLLTIIELCPSEQEKSPELVSLNKGTTFPMKRHPINKDSSLYLSRSFVSPGKALAFFGNADNTQRIFEMKTGSIALNSLGKLTAEPADGNFVLIPSNLYEVEGFGAVLPRRAVSSRVCALLDLDGITLRIFTEDELLKIREFVKQELAIDLINYSECFGAIILSCPDPYIRHIDERLTNNRDGVIVELLTRENYTMIGGEIELSDERLSGQGFIKRHLICKERDLISIPYMPHKLRTRVFSPDKELIEDNSAPFITSINISMGIATGKRRLSINNQTKKTVETYDIDQIYRDKEITVGDESYTTTKLLSDKERDRLLSSLETQKVFMYFPGRDEDSVNRAKLVIRDLIQSAHQRCMICDPYLSAKDVINFALFITGTNMSLRLLSSASFLSTEITDGGCVITQGEKLYDTLECLKQQDKNFRAECKVLRGKKSPLHDRLIVIDKDVYLLGSSLNEFGSRATTLFKAPNAVKMITEMEKFWMDSQISIGLGDWVSNIRKGTNNGEDY
jgi:hypothetical protein